MKLKRRDVETSIEATIQTLRNTLEFVREQDVRDREDRLLLYRPRGDADKSERPPRQPPARRQRWPASATVSSGPSRDAVTDPGDRRFARWRHDRGPRHSQGQEDRVGRLASGRAAGPPRRSAGRRRSQRRPHFIPGGTFAGAGPDRAACERRTQPAEAMLVVVPMRRAGSTTMRRQASRQPMRLRRCRVVPQNAAPRRTCEERRGCRSPERPSRGSPTSSGSV